MFDIGWQELFIVAVIGIIVVGPKDLPAAIRTIMGYLRKARSLARDFQSGLDEVAREADLDTLKKELEGAASYDLEKEIENTIDPTGDVAREITDWENDLNTDDALEGGYSADDDGPAVVDAGEDSRNAIDSQEEGGKTPDTPAKANG